MKCVGPSDAADASGTALQSRVALKVPKKLSEGAKSKGEIMFDRKSRSEGRKGSTRAAKKNGAGVLSRVPNSQPHHALRVKRLVEMYPFGTIRICPDISFLFVRPVVPFWMFGALER